MLVIVIHNIRLPVERRGAELPANRDVPSLRVIKKLSVIVPLEVPAVSVRADKREIDFVASQVNGRR